MVTSTLGTKGIRNNYVALESDVGSGVSRVYNVMLEAGVSEPGFQGTSAATSSRSGILVGWASEWGLYAASFLLLCLALSMDNASRSAINHSKLFNLISHHIELM